MKQRDFFLGLTLGLICSTAFLIISDVDRIIHTITSYIPLELTEAERSAKILVYPMPETHVSVWFESEEEWKSHGFDDRVEGYSLIRNSPCEIHLRAQDWNIRSRPAWGYAVFDKYNADDDMTAVFGHEMLHCLRGLWHPSWSDIQKSSSISIITSPERSRRDGE